MARQKKGRAVESPNDLPISIVQEICDRPLSDLLSDEVDVPVKDVHCFVHRSFAQRMEEAERKGKIKRPMNAFLLYRVAYYAIFEEYLRRRSHCSDAQTVSKVIGLKWHSEETAVRSKFKKLADIERLNHSKLYSEPNQSATKEFDSRMKLELPSTTTPDPEANGAFAISYDGESSTRWTFERPGPHAVHPSGPLWPTAFESGVLDSPSVPSDACITSYLVGDISDQDEYHILAGADFQENCPEGHWSRSCDQTMCVQYINPQLLLQ